MKTSPAPKNVTGGMRKVPRVLGAVGLAIVVLVAASAGINTAMGAVEMANILPYGEKVGLGGGEVNVMVTGDSDRTLVLRSGYGGASPVLDFKPLIDDLDDDFTVVVIERFGYGYSDLDVTDRTVENISTELHDTLAGLKVQGSYVLVAHSLAGIYSLDYISRFPGEVSALVTIDATVPEDFAVAPRRSSWERLLSVSGWVRWMTALNPAITAPAAPAGVYPEATIGKIRSMTVWNYANPAIIDENNRMAENFAAVSALAYPADLPVLAFLSQQLVNANAEWYPAHARQLELLDRSQIVVLADDHYLYWTHSREIGITLRQFLR
ncbi:pimeloyl-ACP methyl ester carboxylesterase [Arthrobacter ginsengisoli]|uniref:Pimeloyl-ACP methyl ester carboxylesterase n=1 Tax=Arthrobacter ginsengisoli TaxID=1356565 RepID=A0ABU1UA78_9MICC|nr:alpha/beta hydrolase [Arthrobacter ginsengisoli]MDR7082096.1 pimeloyl-ACP methyl ester carboxylesterase [Arthrobacter ginsengisoli]